MTNPPYGPTPGGQWPPPGPPAGPPPAWPSAAPKQSRTPVIVSLVIAVVAIAVALGAWFRPTDETPPDTKATPQFTDQQVSDAKNATCSAYDKAFKAVTTAGGQISDDPSSKFIISVNVRLATQVASSYLTKTITQNPATPVDLATNIRDISSIWEDIVLAQLAGSQNDELAPVYDKLEAANSKIKLACK